MSRRLCSLSADAAAHADESGVEVAGRLADDDADDAVDDDVASVRSDLRRAERSTNGVSRSFERSALCVEMGDDI